MDRDQSGMPGPVIPPPPTFPNPNELPRQLPASLPPRPRFPWETSHREAGARQESRPAEIRPLPPPPQLPSRAPIRSRMSEPNLQGRESNPGLSNFQRAHTSTPNLMSSPLDIHDFPDLFDSTGRNIDGFDTKGLERTTCSPLSLPNQRFQTASNI